MARHKKTVKPLPTIWQVGDELWDIIQDILNQLDPPAKTGRPFDGELTVEPRTGQRELKKRLKKRDSTFLQKRTCPG